MAIVSGSILEHTLEHLLPETVYRIRVQAVNAVGVGPFSSTVKVATSALPPLPPRLECVAVGHNHIKLKWGDGKNSEFIHYTLEMENRSGSFVPIYNGTSHTYKVNKLSESMQCNFRILATNEAGSGPYSDVFTLSTSKAPPPSLKAPKISSITESSCRVEWQAAKPFPEDTIVYQLQLLDTREQEYKMLYRGLKTEYTISDLDAGSEYLVRVGTIRQCQDGTPDLFGAYSQSASFTTTNREHERASTSKSSIPTVLQSVERKPLTDQQWAMLILMGFALVAVLIAVLAQQIISHTN